MAITKIVDLWTPAVWADAMREKQATAAGLWNSPAVVKSQLFDALASAGGTAANIPLWKDLTDADDEIQVESTGPNVTALTGGHQIAPITNRVAAYGATALAAAVTGSSNDPIAEIIAQISDNRDKRRQKRLISILRGLFGTGTSGARNGAAAYSACRLGGTTDEPFTETGLGATDDQLFSADMFISGKALMGEIGNDLLGGILLIHSTVLARLELIDKETFKTGIQSELPFTARTYRGLQVVVSDSLSRAGTTNGKVYDTYIIAPGAIAFGAKPQAQDEIDVASLQYHQDKEKNDAYVYDRTREIVHILGAKWQGTPVGQSATNAELATAGNWDLVATSAARCGVVAIRTNG